MTKDNWIKAFCAEYLCDDGCIIGDPCRWCLSKAERIYEDFQSQISQVEHDAIERGKKELIDKLPLEKDHVYRCWLENGSVMFADEGKFKITKEKYAKNKNN